ncbi:MAG: hypothetical protein ACTH3D_09060 [Halomonas sp.]|uniref:hypothetical protein n=1 Tax=Halomonas sp. TaxID=1486246 RepID=UPI003F923A70
MMRQRLLILLLLMTLLSACAGTPDRSQTVRQALIALGQHGADEILKAPQLPKPQYDQVLLLATPDVDSELSIPPQQLLESIARGLLGVDQGPQVLDWAEELPENNNSNLWWLASRLESTAPPLTLSDRVLLPYRLNLTLRRPGSKEALWQTSLDGALDADAL